MQRIFFRVMMFFILITFLQSSMCSAENLKFVDSIENTGYYVDMDTVKLEGQNIINAKIAIIKINSKNNNKKHILLYNLRINYKEQNYQVMSSTIIAYETREVLEQDNNQTFVRFYAQDSPMFNVVNFILNGGK